MNQIAKKELKTKVHISKNNVRDMIQEFKSRNTVNGVNIRIFNSSKLLNKKPKVKSDIIKKDVLQRKRTSDGSNTTFNKTFVWSE